MKFIVRYIYYLLLPLAIAFGSCSKDDLYEDLLEPSDKPGLYTVGYMSVSLKGMEDDTRAFGDDYDMGLSSETSLSSEAKHYAIIYSDKNVPVAIGELTGMGSDQIKDRNASVVFASVVTRNESKDVLRQLKDCYVILNTTYEIEDLWSKTKEDLYKMTIDSPFFFNKSGKRYHTMASSVYVENGAKKIYTQIDPEQIFSSYLETIEQAWKGNAAVKAYVERASAKFSLSFANDAFNQQDADRVFIPANNEMIFFSHINDAGIPFYQKGHDPNNPNVGKYTYRIRITGWGLNGLERKSYLFRHFDESKNYFNGWYKTSDKRAFWSEDINYSKATYPWQYRRVIDNSGIPVYQSKVINGKDMNLLENFSFTKLNDNKFVEPYLYAPENTYDNQDSGFRTELDNRIEYLAGTHIIVCAEVLTNVNDPNRWEVVDLYRDRNNNFYKNEKDAFTALLEGMDHAIESHSYLQFTYYDWDNGGVEMKLYAKTDGDYGIYYKGKRLTPKDFSLLEDHLTSEAEFKGSDGKRIIWADGMEIRRSDGKPLEIYTNIDLVNPDNDKFLRNAGDNDYKSLIFEHVGALDHYKDGKMYYAIPIGYLQDDTASTPSQSKYTAYGVVRNSEYSIMIHNITGFGASVDNVEDPIIPNQVKTYDNLYISFEILDWHKTEQNVPGVVQ